MYETQTSYRGTTPRNGYLNNILASWTLTPNNSSNIFVAVNLDPIFQGYSVRTGMGVRPSINLKSDVKIVSGSGTEEDPYRLAGDNDSNLRGTMLNTRYSGEYIRFGIGENNLYQIVSHENGTGTKIVSAEPLKDSGSFKLMLFGGNNIFSSTNTIGTFLNGEYLTSGKYLTTEQVNMIEDSSTWYLGNVGNGENYKLSKYTDTSGNTLTSNITNAKVGLLRLGELMAGQFDIYTNTYGYWLLTPVDSYRYINIVGSASAVNRTYSYGWGGDDGYGVKPAMNLKFNVVITGGTGTKENPFIIELDN